MLAVFYLTFNVIGSFFSDLLDAGIGALTTLVENALVSAGFSGVLRSLIIDGVFKGVGSVLSFLPFIVTLFFFLSLLEDSGYMARIAFVMDKPLRKHRSFRPKHRPDARRLRLHRSRRDGHAHPALRARPQNDHPAHAVHELLRQIADLCVLLRRLLPALRDVA